MKTWICDGCGNPFTAGQSIGRAMLCHECGPKVRGLIDDLRDANQPVNALHVARKLYKNENSSGNYMLRDVPKNLMDEIKHLAIDQACPVREIVIKSLYEYINKRNK